MPRIHHHILSTALVGAGACAWTLAGRPLVTDPALAAPLNPLGINGSPYGEVFAMAMQGPIDTYFHGASTEGSHQHAPGENCELCKSSPTPKNTSSFQSRFSSYISSLEKAVDTRTNPKAATEGHKRYLRRQVEDKLRFAYQLDPAHYANYNSLHFFLTEPQLGTRPELTPSAAKLAEETIQYCLKHQDDPRPMLTAAAACTNILQLMFNDRLNASPRFSTEQMRQYLAMLDYCLGRYATISQEWEKSGNWQLLSPLRIAECGERFDFICKIRNSAEGTILRFEGRSHTQASN